ncbi:unnamed protein product [Ixodes pacificus]
MLQTRMTGQERSGSSASGTGSLPSMGSGCTRDEALSDSSHRKWNNCCISNPSPSVLLESRAEKRRPAQRACLGYSSNTTRRRRVADAARTYTAKPLHKEKEPWAIESEHHGPKLPATPKPHPPNAPRNNFFFFVTGGKEAILGFYDTDS